MMERKSRKKVPQWQQLQHAKELIDQAKSDVKRNGAANAKHAAHIAKLLANSNGGIRILAVEAIGSMKLQVYARDIAEVLQQPHPGTGFCIAAVMVLTDFFADSEKSLQQLIRKSMINLLGSNDERVRMAASDFILATQHGHDYDDTMCEQIVNAFSRLEDKSQRASIGIIYGMLGTDRAVPLFIKLLENVDTQLRVTAVGALSYLNRTGQTSNTAAVSKMLDDPSEVVRLAAARACEKEILGSEQALKLLKDSCSEVRAYVARAAARWVTDDCSGELLLVMVALLDDHDVCVQRAVLASLLQMHEVRARLGAHYVSKLVGCLQNPDLFVRDYAAVALLQIGVHGAIHADMLAKLFSTNDSEVYQEDCDAKLMALQAVGNLGSNGVKYAGVLATLAANQAGAGPGRCWRIGLAAAGVLRGMGRHGTEAFLNLLEDPESEHLSESVISFLRYSWERQEVWVGADACVARVTNCLLDPSQDVRSQAVRFLAVARPESLAHSIEGLMQNERKLQEENTRLQKELGDLRSSQIQGEGIGKGSAARSRSPKRSPEMDLWIEGFSVRQDSDIQDSFAEEDWDKLRQYVSVGLSCVKQEDAIPDRIIEVAIDRVYFLQLSCSPRFKDGLWLEQTVADLQSGVIDPLEHSDFILNVAIAELRCPEFSGQRHPPRTITMWTFDHRRLHAMRVAGCKRVRVRVKLEGKAFSEFANKSIDVLGKRSSIRVR